MGTTIESVGISMPSLFRRGSINLEADAAKDCLNRVGRGPNEVDLIVRAGIYRDKHMVEPATSSFVQRKLGATSFLNGKGTFSFDLNNGACGLLTGMQVIDGFIRSGKVKFGLVVAGDSEPISGQSEGFDFPAAASAVLLTLGREGEGFTVFKTQTYSQFKDGFGSTVEWDENRRKHMLVMKERADYVSHCVECALDSLNAFLGHASVGLRDVDLVIPSQSPKGFVETVKKETGFGEKIIDVANELGNIHTAAIGAALEKAFANGVFRGARNVLFLAVGSGITVSMALYRNFEAKN
jgi:3-oxoacyl-[acyl-carrier-protein] synthase-3